MSSVKTTDKTTARTAGMFYLLVAVCGGFAELYVRDRIIVPGNAAETAANLHDV